MKINADFSQRAVQQTQELPWIDSPMPGVQRRMLERDGEEVARATSIVRYAPGSSFSAHTHGGGEEFLVLEGVFSDEMGDYTAGTYVRNPVSSRHTPFSNEGAVILVKLWQMSPLDQTRVVIDTNNQPWKQGLNEGEQIIPLHTYETENVALVKWERGTQVKNYAHLEGEEIFVLQGEFSDELGTYPQGCWIRNPPGVVPSRFTEQGSLLYLKTGHLG
ncbi:cupin domain-containing protein [Gloeothece verrucosa]|uniref:Anti-ECFsigma factor, ChrR n=1 Tax=Gloeothece verrucosa (strain PCC 7822) TaxID=497965 RepID=E0UNE7_GLOV7|nr:cupin domain-containing protein [Gloeothece verrucosa]ADN18477.1 anti-ECFsigma factor, ChrR [Gloeothece verrucosa PCC 7822]